VRDSVDASGESADDDGLGLGKKAHEPLCSFECILRSIPRTDDRDARNHLMVVALLEQGGPMSLEEIAARLERAGVEARTGDLALSLQKAWHGLKPVWRDPEGLFHLDPDPDELYWILLVTGLRPRPPLPDPPPAPPEPPPRPDTEPLAWEEVEAAFRDRSAWDVSPLRQAAAVLDARGPVLRIGEVESALDALSRWRLAVTEQAARAWTRPPVRLEGQRLVLDRGEEEALHGMRRAIRKRARRTQVARLESKRLEEVRARTAAFRAQRERFQRKEAAGSRRAILHVVPSPKNPRAAGLLDLGDRSIRTFLGDEMAALEGALEGFDVVAGLHLLNTLHVLGLDHTRWRIIDLKPPQKTRRLNRSGRTLRITTEMLMSATTGIGRPLGDTAKKARYLAEGQAGRLARRLGADLKSLAAYYRYGLLHGVVRLHWGFLDEMLGVDWRLPGDLSLGDYLRASRDEDRILEIVIGTVPGWEDPWARGWRIRVVDVDWDVVRIVSPDGMDLLDKVEIQAVRFAPPMQGAAP